VTHGIVIADAFLQLCCIINIPDLAAAALEVELLFDLESCLAPFLVFRRLCQGGCGLGGTPKPNGSVKSLQVEHAVLEMV
jgi:hypothetical protein